jgi:hypothetical protein
MKNLHFLFKTSAALWVIWGLVHILAGVMTMKGVLTNEISASIIGIADGVNPESLTMDYPKAAGAVIGQHGFNLFWIGLVTFISAFFVWKGNRSAVLLAAICGGLADLGYFLFLDIGGFVHFVPGTVMTIISSFAIITSFFAIFNRKTED